MFVAVDAKLNKVRHFSTCAVAPDLQGGNLLVVSTAAIRILMTQTIETTWGFEHHREDAVSHHTSPPWGGAGGVSSRVSISLFRQRERERGPLRLSSISSLWGSNQMDTLITLLRFRGS